MSEGVCEREGGRVIEGNKKKINEINKHRGN